MPLVYFMYKMELKFYVILWRGALFILNSSSLLGHNFLSKNILAWSWWQRIMNKQGAWTAARHKINQLLASYNDMHFTALLNYCYSLIKVPSFTIIKLQKLHYKLNILEKNIKIIYFSASLLLYFSVLLLTNLDFNII